MEKFELPEMELVNISLEEVIATSTYDPKGILEGSADYDWFIN